MQICACVINICRFFKQRWICDTIAMLAVCNEIRAIPGLIRAPLSIFNQNSPTRGGGTYEEFKLFMLARVLRVANLWRQGEKVDKIKRGLQDSHPGLNSFHPHRALFFNEIFVDRNKSMWYIFLISCDNSQYFRDTITISLYKKIILFIIDKLTPPLFWTDNIQLSCQIH